MWQCSTLLIMNQRKNQTVPEKHPRFCLILGCINTLFPKLAQ
uniref:Uncharacterized protein n=1 Tax=Anguilla anguilla TaxID=7936 RepID=A0A0E9UM87_ANGAN